jgi:hypothetical protein
MELQEAFEQILPQGHPSFGTQRALFLFALGEGLLSVEATNPWAVLCIEHLLVEQGRVSDNCELLQVVRDYRNVGTRSDRTQEVPFVDFMIDIADVDRLHGVAAECFKNALSPEDRQVALLKLRAVQTAPHDVFAGMQPETTVAVESPVLPQVDGEDQSDKLTSALVGLGFKKTEVRKFVAELGDRTRSEDLHSLLREGLRALAA